ncbi:hypothetical protein QAD02_002234 [Eretmocerus hayati]|uniref:Uncharacterized protein n=1 Tax=Eretmocerus hayati TaxID=131215 RepID=A0ACC2NIB9_9HYME|nr:hypothetical protein QAD02_002234 [Eretmocerus hayati]
MIDIPSILVEYSKEPNFSEQWNELQREFSCCGVTGPLDFGPEWPQSCCSTPSVIISSSTPSATAVSTKKVVMVARSDQYSESDDENFAGVNSSRSIDSDPTLSGKCEQPRTRGCEETLQIWLRKTADLLFVLGFCVIAFTKFCFLGILRYEIREMIQKIRLMKEPTPENIPPAQPFCPLQQQLQQLVDLSSNNAEFEGITTAMTVPAQNPIGTHSRLGREDLSSQTMGDKMRSSKQPSIVANHYDVGADSDTNSHCALILEESTPPARHYVSPSNRRQQQWPGKGTPSVNSLELRELNFSTSLHTTDDSSKTQVKELHP